MSAIRGIRKVFKARPTVEGAGVHLKRAFGNEQVPQLDPFLLLDDFHSSTPADYIKGFPWHPHRGMETISYVLAGRVEHGDSMGNKGVISSGDVQWMTAGSGIIHQEMPRGDENSFLWGLQLWSNLPASHKMMEPRYQDIRKGQVPTMTLENGVVIRVICGKVGNLCGPVKEIVTDPEYLDVSVPPGEKFTHGTRPGHTVFAYVLEGEGCFAPGREEFPTAETLVLFQDGEELAVTADSQGVRFLLVSGRPIGEPVAWYGPIVMNTREELEIAFEEYGNGTFLKHAP